MVNCDSSSEGKSEGQQDVISNMGCGPAEFPAVFHLAHLTARATLLDELLVQTKTMCQRLRVKLQGCVGEAAAAI